MATIKRFRALCWVDLNTIVEVEDGKPSAKLVEKLSSDPVLLVDVLYAVCKPECDQHNVSDEDFGAAMAGDAVEQSTDALLDEVIFFPRGEAGGLPPDSVRQPPIRGSREAADGGAFELFFNSFSDKILLF